MAASSAVGTLQSTQNPPSSSERRAQRSVAGGDSGQQGEQKVLSGELSESKTHHSIPAVDTSVPAPGLNVEHRRSCRQRFFEFEPTASNRVIYG
jgi:hypothetical protein